MGYDQEKLQEEIYNRASFEFNELKEEEVTSIRMAMELGIVPSERKEFFEANLKFGRKVPVMMSPENVHLFVSGGAPGCAFSFSYYRLPPYNHTALMTRRITGATLTKAGSE